MPEKDASLKGVDKAGIRQAFITALHDLNDDYGELLPPRADALRFYEDFREDNATVFDTWGDGLSFGDIFDAYPENAAAFTQLDTRQLLEHLLEHLLEQSLERMPKRLLK